MLIERSLSLVKPVAEEWMKKLDEALEQGVDSNQIVAQTWSEIGTEILSNGTFNIDEDGPIVLLELQALFANCCLYIARNWKHKDEFIQWDMAMIGNLIEIEEVQGQLGIDPESLYEE